MRLRSVLTFVVCAIVAGNASASLPTAGATLIVQQRTEDGRILLTNRPVPGVAIERMWSTPGAAPAIAAERESNEPALAPALSRMPRHIDARWRAVDDDPERERIVRVTLERERQQRLMQRVSLPHGEPGLRGSAAPGSRSRW
jgi:hypothetical protein